MTAPVERNDLAGVVLDIEGTTTPVAFVYDVLDHPARRLLFVSDVKEELDAAAAAGFQTVLCVRSGTSMSGSRRVIHSFDELF